LLVLFSVSSCAIDYCYIIVTLASAMAAGIFGGGHGPGSTPTKTALSEIGVSLAKLCFTTSISAGVICLVIFFSSSRFAFGPFVIKQTDEVVSCDDGHKSSDMRLYVRIGALLTSMRDWQSGGVAK
jgi:hypothetical protein